MCNYFVSRSAAKSFANCCNQDKMATAEYQYLLGRTSPVSEQRKFSQEPDYSQIFSKFIQQPETGLARNAPYLSHNLVARDTPTTSEFSGSKSIATSLSGYYLAQVRETYQSTRGREWTNRSFIYMQRKDVTYRGRYKTGYTTKPVLYSTCNHIRIQSHVQSNHSYQAEQEIPQTMRDKCSCQIDPTPGLALRRIQFTHTCPMPTAPMILQSRQHIKKIKSY